MSGERHLKPRTLRDFSASLLWEHAGAVSLAWSFRNWSYNVHFGVSRSCRFWGFDCVWVGGFDFYDYGLGPFVLICWHWAHDAEGNLTGK